MIKKRICKFCGKEFETEYCNKFCSTECLNLATKVKYKKEEKIKFCPVCNKQFTVTGLSKKIVCSKDCAKIYEKQRKTNNLPETGIRICIHCGKEYDYIHGQENWKNPDKSKNQTNRCSIRADKFCCFECGVQHRIENIAKTCIPKYGVKNGGGSIESIKKGQRIKAQHQQENPNYKQEIRNKTKQTNLQKYGVENPLSLKEIQEKKKRNNLKKYGVISPSQLQKVKDKVKNTIEKHKQIDPEYLSKITTKIKNTNIKKFGTDSYAKTKEFKNFIKNIWKNKTEEEILEIINRTKQTKLERYGNPTYHGIEKINWENVVKKGFETKKKNGTLKTSKAEKEIQEFIESFGLKTEKYIVGNNHEIKRFEIDIYIPEKKIGIEYNGIYYHSKNGKNTKSSIKYHYNKSKNALLNGIELIHIWEDQWMNQKDLIKSILCARLGVLNTNDKIYARQCVIHEISKQEYKNFCNINHIQGYKAASVRLGLYYNEKLVQIASFNKVRNTGKASSQNSKYEYEWVRGCPASNNVVIGGTSKLFKYFIKNYNPQSILCYADWNLFNGKGYKECGFEFVSYTGPDKFYVTNTVPQIRINRNPYKYHEFKSLVQQNKLYECYGAGSLKFEWRNSKND